MSSKNRPKIPTYMIVVTYFGNLVLIIFALISALFGVWRKNDLCLKEFNREKYPRLYDRLFYFFYRKICFHNWDIHAFPICTFPADKIKILDRKTRYIINGRQIEAINFGSYNYLGYSQNYGPITDSVETIIKELGIGVCSSAVETGRQQIYCELESLVAQYLGVDDAIVFGMGFGTNAYTMSALFSKGCLVMSDELNHASIILGRRLSGATVKVFKHNDMNDLEEIVRNSIIEGQPMTGRAWKKIIIIVEGIYSMEGTIANLPEVLRIKKKYKLYLYLDEAHSIGAMGKNGKGICDYFGCNPKEVDILMGTFTKSFAAAGGYIAGERSVIQYMRCQTAGFHYGQPVTPPIIQQIKGVLMDLCENQRQSHWRLKRLNENAVYFRRKLIEKGFHIDGDSESPVIPLMVYSDTYLRCFVQKLQNSGIATAAVFYPVTSILGSRLRFCVSASHTRSMIVYAINTIDRIGTELALNFSKSV